ncbi:unnamed protein product, partial [Heterosigma akashiwo]
MGNKPSSEEGRTVAKELQDDEAQTEHPEQDEVTTDLKLAEKKLLEAKWVEANAKKEFEEAMSEVRKLEATEDELGFGPLTSFTSAAGLSAAGEAVPP